MAHTETAVGSAGITEVFVTAHPVLVSPGILPGPMDGICWLGIMRPVRSIFTFSSQLPKVYLNCGTDGWREAIEGAKSLSLLTVFHSEGSHSLKAFLLYQFAVVIGLTYPWRSVLYLTNSSLYLFLHRRAYHDTRTVLV